MNHTKESTSSRKVKAVHLADYEGRLKNKSSQREAAKAIGVSRGALRHWKSRKERIPLPEKIVDFLESPDGTDLLHRIMTALQLVMNEEGGCGIRLISSFLKVCHFHHFVSSSYEALRCQNVKLEEHIVNFGEEEKGRLSPMIKEKRISIAEDETFHPEPCLVAIEPVSNFILLEQYSKKRDAASWNKAMDEALSGLNVEVIQSISDEAKGLVSHTENHMGVKHSPDVFHIQQELSKAGSAAVASKVKKAESELVKAEENISQFKKLEEEPHNGKGRKPKVLKCPLSDLEAKKVVAEAEVKKCKEQQEKFAEVKRGIGEDYHPYDLETGKAVQEVELERSLNKHVNDAKSIAEEIKLRDSGIKKIEKVSRMIPKLVSTLQFYWVMLGVLLKSLNITESQEQLMREIIIPAQYLLIAGRKGKDAKTRELINESAKRLHARLENEEEWLKLSDTERIRLKNAAEEAANYFQRSSSCVEGRNGYLSLRRHGLHRLSDRKLNTLTILHNYWIKRRDGSTAAERFFLNKPRDLFEYLLEKMPYPGRPGKVVDPPKKVA